MKLLPFTKPNKIFVWIIMASLILRILIMLFSFQFRENTDILRYKDWGRIAFLYNLEETYHNTHLEFGTQANNHPPGSLYIISESYNLQIQVTKVFMKIFNIKEGEATWINIQLLYAFLRLPSILSDLVIGILIFTIIKSKTSLKNAIFGSSLFLFNPATLYNSAFWGQMDSINNLLFMLSLFFFYHKKFFFSLFTLFLSLYVKVSLVFIVPFYIFFLWKNVIKNYFKLALQILCCITSIILLTIPVSRNPIAWLIESISKNALGEMQHITNFAFNFWWLIFKPSINLGSSNNLFTFSQIRLLGSPADSANFLTISLSVWGAVLFLIFSTYMFYVFLKSKKEMRLENLFLLLSMLAMLGFLFLPRMHERYLYPFFPLFAVYIGLTKKSIGRFLFLSLFSLINLYIVWHPMKIAIMPYVLMNNSTFQWLISCAIVAIGTSLYLNSIKRFLSYGKT